MLSEIQIRSFGPAAWSWTCRADNASHPISVFIEFYYAGNAKRTYQLNERWTLGHAREVRDKLSRAIAVADSERSSAKLNWDY